MPIIATTTPPKDIIDALNVTPFEQELFEDALEFHRQTSGLGLLSRWADPRWLRRTIFELGVSGAGDDAELEKRIISSRLRALVDEWLATGRCSDGSESPAQKDLFRTAGAIKAVENYTNENPVTVTVDRDLSMLLVKIGTRPDHKKGDPYPAEFFTDFFQRAVNQADRLFTVLMLSVWKNQLCRCRYAPCGKYFRWLKKSRQSRRHGTFCCREHQGRASAMACTNSLRARAKQELIESAARQLLKWEVGSPRWQDDADQKRRLAKELCFVIERKRLHGYLQEVKGNWVTRHRSQIEQKRRELKAK